MKKNKQHLFLLGPPAVGKLSVARALSASTGYPVFDNAKTVDIAGLLHPYGTDRFRSFRDELRFTFYRETAFSEATGLISTFCYRHSTNWEYLHKVDEILRKGNWHTCYFLLLADASALKKRVVSTERRDKKTLYTTDEIEEWLSSSPGHKKINGIEGVTIDTTLLEIQEVALMIVETMENVDGS